MASRKKDFNGKEYLANELKEWGLDSARLGGLEYIVATNFLMLRELQKINAILRKIKPKDIQDLLDVS